LRLGKIGLGGRSGDQVDGNFEAAVASDVLKALDDELIGFGAVAFEFTGAETLIFFVGDGVFFGLRILRSAEDGVFGAAILSEAFDLSLDYLKRSVTARNEKSIWTNIQSWHGTDTNDAMCIQESQVSVRSVRWGRAKAWTCIA
jgi:hypothetical protein